MTDAHNPNASHSDEGNLQQDSEIEQSLQDYYKAFGIERPHEQEIQEVDESNDADQEDDFEEEMDPAIDPEPSDDLKGLQVKYNGEEKVIPEDEVKGYVEKGMNYDKIKTRNQQYESALDRLAKQQGYKDHADLLNNIDQIEAAAQQRQKDQFEELKLSMREEAMNAGIDPDVLDQYLDNHPLLQQAREVLQNKETEQTTRQQEQQQQQLVQGWEALFKKYPDLAKEMTDEGTDAPWFTPEMNARIQRGYDPIDAYELVHRDKLTATERKKAEQAVLKNQRLNKRAQVESQAAAALEPQAPAELTGAFAMFGIDPKKANKYAKNFE